MITSSSLKFMLLLMLAIGAGVGMALEDLLVYFRFNMTFNAVVLGLGLLGFFLGFMQLWLFRFDDRVLMGLVRGRVRHPGRQRLNSTHFLLRALLAKFSGTKANFTQKFATAFYEDVKIRLQNRMEILHFLTQACLYSGLIGGFYEVFVLQSPANETFAGEILVTSPILAVTLYLLLRLVEVVVSNAYNQFLARLSLWLAEPTTIELEDDIRQDVKPSKEPKL